MIEAVISHSTIVTGNLTGTRGPIGLIVHDEEASRLVAISVANVVDDECRLAETGQLVGTTSAMKPERFLRARLRPASSLLSTVLIDETVAISEGRINLRGEWLYPTLNREPGQKIGRPVLVHLPGRPVMEALVVSTSAKFAMHAPDSGSPAFFEDALELFLTGGEERARRGDAGALVTTDRGEVVGLVVSAKGSSTFAAPVAPFLRDLRACVPLDAGIVDRHNQLARASGATQEETATEGEVDATAEAETTTLNSKAVEAGAAWEEAERSGRKEAMLRAATLIDESCFA